MINQKNYFDHLVDEVYALSPSELNKSLVDEGVNPDILATRAAQLGILEEDSNVPGQEYPVQRVDDGSIENDDDYSLEDCSRGYYSGEESWEIEVEDPEEEGDLSGSSDEVVDAIAEAVMRGVSPEAAISMLLCSGTLEDSLPRLAKLKGLHQLGIVCAHNADNLLLFAEKAIRLQTPSSEDNKDAEAL